MILTCPECATQYGIPDGAISEKGRKVKCVQCAHVWRQMPVSTTDNDSTTSTSNNNNQEVTPTSDKSENQNSSSSLENEPANDKPKLPDIEATSTSEKPSTTKPTPANAHKPTIAPPIKTAASIKIAFAVFLALALILGTIKFHLLGSVIGQANYNGMMITNFTAEKSQGVAGQDFQLTIGIKNTSNAEHALPPVHISILSAGGNVMKSLTLPEHAHENTVDKLAPGDSFVYEYALTNISGNAKTINFDIGNGWELAFR